jgi:Xaa-Pro aminopeptidase
MSGGANRDAAAVQVARRREAVARAWDLDGAVVLVAAGRPVPVPGRGDRTYPFRSHAEYLYLTDRERPDGVLAFDPQVGWVDFVAPVTRDEILWSGATADVGGVPLEELDAWLSERAGRPVANLGAPLEGIDSDRALALELRDGLRSVRLPKDAVELERMRLAAAATRAGFVAIRELVRAGATERELQIELEAAFFRAGGDALAFDTIVAGGPNAAVLHFTPGARALRDGELVLIDAGAEFRGYASDVTRTYPVSGRLTADQQAIHEVVLHAKAAATERCRVGVRIGDVQRTATLAIAAGLVDLGILRGDVEELVESGAPSLFFPHGIGHLVGLGIRDAGPPAQPPPDGERGDPGPLRVDLVLRAGIAITVEPGVYFVPALLGNPEQRDRHRRAVAWDRVDELLAFGGVRIEDTVLVTDAEPDVLTADVPLV